MKYILRNKVKTFQNFAQRLYLFVCIWVFVYVCTSLARWGEVGKGRAIGFGVSSPLHLRIKAAEDCSVVLTLHSLCTHTLGGLTLTKLLKTHASEFFVKPVKMPCVSVQLDQMVKLPSSYDSVVDKVIAVRFVVSKFPVL